MMFVDRGVIVPSILPVPIWCLTNIARQEKDLIHSFSLLVLFFRQ